MTRIVDFADGLTSASPPDISGGSIEEYEIENDQSTFADLGISMDEAEHVSAFGSIVLTREDDSPSYYTQTVDFKVIWDGSEWVLEFGSYVGDSVIEETLDSDFGIEFQMSGGDLQYKSGDMSGGSYVGSAKVSITRISL
jgi:hypothetical protein